MSCYNWERGNIVFPAREWTKVKKIVRDAWNKRQTLHFNVATQFYDALVKAAEGKRGFQYESHLWTLYKDYEKRSREPVNFSMITDSILGPYHNRRKKPLKPKLKDFPKANTTTRSFSEDEWSVDFSEDSKRTLLWDVSENNRSVDRAHENPVVIALFRFLESVEWAPKTGGQVFGNDEYNRDSGREYAGGGGSYVVRDYRFKTKKEKEQKKALLRRESAYFGGGYYAGRY